MGFNFGAFLGGAATQITKDIDEEEKRVKLRMDKILDRQQELTIQNQKEFKAKKEKVTNQMNALVPLFGGGPDAIAKARSIVAGGDNHYNFMFSKLSTAQERGDDINQIYSLIPNKDAVGFESVEDATGSLVKMAELPEITIGESSNMAKLFGIDQKAYFNREQQKLVEVGQIISGEKKPAETNFAQGKLNLDKMSKDFKSVSEMQDAKFANELKKLTPGSEEYKAKFAEYETFKKDEAKLTASYLIAKYKEDNDKGDGLSAASMQIGWQKEKKAIQDKFGDRLTLPNGEIVRKGSPKFDVEVKKKVDAYNYEYVKGIVTDKTGLNVNGLAVISANPELKNLLPQVKKDLEDSIATGDKDITLKPGQKIGNLLKKESSKNLSLGIISEIKNIKPNISKAQIFDVLEAKYPKGDSETQEDYDQRMKRLIDLAFKGFEVGEEKKKKRLEDKKKLFEPKKPEKPENLAPKVTSRNRLFDGLSAEEWDNKYGKFYKPDGTLKDEFK